MIRAFRILGPLSLLLTAVSSAPVWAQAKIDARQVSVAGQQLDTAMAAKADAAYVNAELAKASAAIGAYPEMFGAKGDGTTDDTAALQTAITTGNMRCPTGKNYRITGSLTLPPGTTYINGCRITAAFGTNYSRPFITNNKLTDASTTLVIRDSQFYGNGVVFDMRFTADHPNAGLKLIGQNLFFNTNDGNRRAGTSLVVADQIDFMSISDFVTYNTDLAIQLGSGQPRRNSTQIYLAQGNIAQTSSVMRIEGVDKMYVANLDTMKTNSGVDLAGSNSRIRFVNWHVEDIASPSYPSPSARVSSGAAGYAVYARDLAQNNDVIFNTFSVIDAGAVGGGGAGGAYIGTVFNPQLQSIEFNSSTIPTGMNGSPAWKPIVNRGRFRWNGRWPYTNQTSLHTISGQYQDVQITDFITDRPTSANLLPGTTALSLSDTALAGSGSAPVVTEQAETSAFNAGHRVQFTSAGYQMVKQINVPSGWNTLVFEGQRVSGNPQIFAQENGGAFQTFVQAVLVNNDGTNHIWRIPFYNPTPNLSIKIGLLSQSASDALVLNSLTVARGFHLTRPESRQPDVVSALPTVSSFWLNRQVIVRSSGADDTLYVCLRTAAGSLSWVRLS